MKSSPSWFYDVKIKKARKNSRKWKQYVSLRCYLMWEMIFL
jgi:hypothetical protein